MLSRLASFSAFLSSIPLIYIREGGWVNKGIGDFGPEVVDFIDRCADSIEVNPLGFEEAIFRIDAPFPGIAMRFLVEEFAFAHKAGSDVGVVHYFAILDDLDAGKARAVTAIVEIGKGDAYYNKIVRPQLHNFMGKVFEEMCRYYTLREGLDGNLNCFVTQVGTWWGTEIIENDAGQKRIQSADVDIVGLAPSEKAMIVGECKFKNEKTGRDVLETLVRRSRVIPSKYRIVQYLLFSRGGFTEWYENEAPEDVKTFSLDDLYKK